MCDNLKPKQLKFKAKSLIKIRRFSRKRFNFHFFLLISKFYIIKKRDQINIKQFLSRGYKCTEINFRSIEHLDTNVKYRTCTTAISIHTHTYTANVRPKFRLPRRLQIINNGHFINRSTSRRGIRAQKRKREKSAIHQYER